MAAMCEVSQLERLRAVPIIMKGDALNYYANNCSDCRTFDDAMKLLKEWYNSDDRTARILTT